MRCTAILFAMSTTLLSGCFDNVTEQINKLTNEITEVRKVVDTQWAATIKAVPGERYLQLIDAVNEPCDLKVGEEKTACERKKGLAQATLRSIGHLESIDPEGSYEVSVWVVRDAKEQPLDLQMGFFETLTDKQPEVEANLAERKVHRQNATFQNSEFYRMPTSAEIDSRITAALNGTYDRLIGVPGGQAVIDSSTHVAYWQRNRLSTLLDERTCRFPVGEGQEYQVPSQVTACVTNLVTQQREAFVTALRPAIMAPFEKVKSDKQSLRATKVWDVLGSKQLLTIVILDKDWTDKLKNTGAEIFALVHKKGDPRANYSRSTTIRFDPNEFEVRRAKLVIDGENGKKVEYTYAWATENMTDHSFLTAETVQAIHEAQDVLKQWRGEAAPGRQSSGRQRQ